MAKVTFQTDLCKGCGLCVSACPKHILAIAKDQINKKVATAAKSCQKPYVRPLHVSCPSRKGT